MLRLLLIGVLLISCAQAQKPNIVLVMADDIGLGDIGFYHKERTAQESLIPTPNLDELIRQGMRFSDAHSPASLCAPTRFSMMTGNFSYRNKKRPWGVWQPAVDAGIDPHFHSIARLAKEGGYTTAFFGKWGLGGVWDGWPEEMEGYEQMTKGARHFGFDYSLELPQGIQNKPFMFFENGKWLKLDAKSKLVELSFEQTRYEEKEREKKREGIGDSHWDPALAGPILANKAVAYIDKQAKTEKPFFMYYCSQAVHIPHTPAAELNETKIAGTTLGKHGDMIKELDAQVGMILNALKKNGLYENTLFVFTSDNGGLDRGGALSEAGHAANNGFRAHKGSIYEGGHRVPFIAVWPGKIAAGSQSDVTIVGQDMLATVAALAEVPIDTAKVFDSASLLPLFAQSSNKALHKYLLHQSQSKWGPYYALREGDWKVVFKTHGREVFKNMKVIGLYNLTENPYEKASENLMDKPEYKDKIEQMKSTYVKLRKQGASTIY
ncbi:MAG: arylsulfatase [Bacteroidota bacterium]